MASNARINVHCHIGSPLYDEAHAAQRARRTETAAHGGSISRFDADAMFEDMEKGGVTTAIISPSTAPIAIDRDPGEQRKYCRANNEYIADLMSEHPGKIGLFAMLPMPDVDASLEEAAYALDTLHADGVLLWTNYGDRWLADEAFLPLYEELNRRKVVVYTHPKLPNCCANVLSDLHVAASLIEFGTDTARAILQIVFGGTTGRFPDLQFIFSHAGGTMPALIERFTDLAKTPRFAAQFPDGYAAVAREFFYDTAQTANKAAMSALAAVVPTSQILYGTDFPYRTSEEHVEGLKASGVFSAADLEAIDSTNAHRLFPRLSA